ncbi:MAG TPA: aspartate--ammonia ligase, partial [Bacillota bacterium]|nr:aspartate--ammonia ligase [Bacillota bacterium]
HIVRAICATLAELKRSFPTVGTQLDEDVFFITSQELEDLYPSLTPKQREDEIIKKHPTAFIMQIGAPLRSGKPHDGRAPDYDDWSINGDLMFYDKVLGHAMEISSMGVRVDPESLRSQLRARGLEKREKLYFHSLLLSGALPLTIGGGIGQSRLCMLLLGKAHIGEVQSSIWDDATVTECTKAGIELL